MAYFYLLKNHNVIYLSTRHNTYACLELPDKKFILSFLIDAEYI